MDETRFEDFTGLIAAIAKEVQRIKSVESARLGLAGADIMCLYYLGKHADGMTGADLARASGVTRAAVSRSLARMEQQGFVESGASGADEAKYRTPIRLTSRGTDAAKRADTAIGHVLDEVAGVQDAAAREQMYTSLRLVLGCLRELSRE